MDCTRLKDYDLIILNTSAGKDSLVMMWDILRRAKKENYPIERIVCSHQDLGRFEWPGTKVLVETQASIFGLKTYYSKRRNKDGYEENLLEYVLRRRKWPSNKQRWCTSDFKRGPGARVVTKLTKDLGKCKVLYVFGFRSQESPARAKKNVIEINKNLSTKNRTVHTFNPILGMDIKKVWRIIKLFKLPYHYAYDLGMPRLSCIFCIFSPFDALVIAGIENMELLEEYISVEEEINHTFRDKFSLKEVRKSIEEGYRPKGIPDWVM